MAHGTSKVVEAVRKSGRPAILTNNGVPVAAVLALDDRAVATLTDYVLMNAPEYVHAMEQMDAALASDQQLEVVTEESLPDSADLPTNVPTSAPEVSWPAAGEELEALRRLIERLEHQVGSLQRQLVVSLPSAIEAKLSAALAPFSSEREGQMKLGSFKAGSRSTFYVEGPAGLMGLAIGKHTPEETWGEIDARPLEELLQTDKDAPIRIELDGDVVLESSAGIGHFELKEWPAGLKSRRVDDVINVAGHWLGTKEFESASLTVDEVAEAASVPVMDELRGGAVDIYIALKPGIKPSKQIKEEVSAAIERLIGEIARPKNVWIVPDMPKTRSGKIMRRVIASISNFTSPGDLTTLANPEVVDIIKHQVESEKLKTGQTPRELSQEELEEIKRFGRGALTL